jgi:hypothetical protein
MGESLSLVLLSQKSLANTSWGKHIGGVQMALNFRMYLSESKVQRLTQIQKYLGISLGFESILSPFIHVLALIAGPINLIVGIPTMFATDIVETKLLLRLQCILVIFNWIQVCHTGLLTGFRFVARDAGSHMVPCEYFKPRFR